MDEESRKVYIRSLLRAVEQDLLESVKDIPETWTGREIRALVAGRFNQEAREHAANRTN